MESINGIRVIDENYKKFRDLPFCKLDKGEEKIFKDGKFINPYNELYYNYTDKVRESIKWGKKMVKALDKANQIIKNKTTTLERLRALIRLEKISRVPIHIPLMNDKYMEIYMIDSSVGINILSFNEGSDEEIDAVTLIAVELVGKKFYSMDIEMLNKWKNKLHDFNEEQKIIDGLHREYYHCVSKNKVRFKLFPETFKYNNVRRKTFRRPKRVNMATVVKQFDTDYCFNI